MNFSKCTDRKYFICFLILLTVVVILFRNSEPKWPQYNVQQQNGKETSRLNICKDILNIEAAANSSGDDIVAIATEYISSAKRDRIFVRNGYYLILSKVIPSIFEKSEQLKGFNGSNVTVSERSRLDRLNWTVPYLPCRLRNYAVENVDFCLGRRSSSNQPFHITFLGDSRLRRLVEVLLEFMHSLDLTISTSSNETISLDDFLGEKGNILWPKYKQQFNASTSKHPNLLISFYWAPYLSQSLDRRENTPPHWRFIYDNKVFNYLKPRAQKSLAIVDDEAYIKAFKEDALNSSARVNTRSAQSVGGLDQIRKWLKMPSKDLPQYVFVNTGSWQLESSLMDDPLRNIDKWAISGTFKLRRALEALSSRTNVILVLPEPIKGIEYLYLNSDVQSSYFRMQNNDYQEWYMNAQLHLMPKNLQLWDSFIPFYYASHQDCYRALDENLAFQTLPSFLRFAHEETLACNQRIHTGYEAMGIGLQMLMNHICNDLMTPSDETLDICCINIM